MIRCIRHAAILLILPSALAAQQSPIDLAHARAYFDELAALGAADGGRLWGRAIAGPLLFADRQSRTVVANMPDSAGVLRASDGVWTGTLPPEINVANTALRWAGREWSMVMWPVPDSRYSRRRLLVHESFHRIQDELGLPAADRGNAHFASADARIWTRLEWRALAEALLGTGAARTQALGDALTFRARRRMLHPAAAEEERAVELNEGLAEYTGLVLSGLPVSAQHDRAAVQLAQYEQQENFARNFAYASGPAYALLLDARGRQWRPRLDAASDLGALAARAYGIGTLNPARADALIARYDGARMVAEERAREAQRLVAEARMRARFVDGATLTLPVRSRFRYSFDPNGAVPLPGEGTVFQSARITDEWGVLDVKANGVLLRRPADLITAVIVPVPTVRDDAPLQGDGWTLELAPGWRVVPGPRTGDWFVEPVGS